MAAVIIIAECQFRDGVTKKKCVSPINPAHTFQNAHMDSSVSQSHNDFPSTEGLQDAWATFSIADRCYHSKRHRTLSEQFS